MTEWEQGAVFLFLFLVFDVVFIMALAIVCLGREDREAFKSDWRR